MTVKYFTRFILSLAVLLGIAMALSGSLQADMVIYEGFNYEAGVLSGRDGGTGFSGPWASTRNNPAAAEPGKTWGTLPVEGNYAKGSAWSGLIRPIGTTLSDAGLMANGSTLWFSVIYGLEGQNFTNADLNLSLGTDKFVSGTFGDRENLQGVAAEGIGVTHSGARIQGVYWQDIDADDVAERVENNSSLYINGQVGNPINALIVGKIDWGADATANETLTLYAPDAALAIGTEIMAAWTIPALDQSLFDTLALQFKDTSQMDEIRFGSTYEDVIGNPEPPPALTLQVNPFTGATTLLGDSSEALSFNYYEITSAGNSLDDVNWVSLTDQDFEGSGPPSGTGDGWEEAGGIGSHALAEAYLQGSSEIGASETVSLGMGYDPSVNAQDLVFKYRVQPGEAVQGDVIYDNFNPDIDGNGGVDAGDLSLLLSSYYEPLEAEADGMAPYSPSELGILLNSFGWTATNASAAEVPEPGTFSLLLFGAMGLSVLRRRK